MTERLVTARDRLVALAAALQGVPNEPVDTIWKRGEEFVARLEAEPDKPVQCPCCTKQVVLCAMHWRLHAPGTKCRDCESEAE